LEKPRLVVRCDGCAVIWQYPSYTDRPAHLEFVCEAENSAGRLVTVGTFPSNMPADAPLPVLLELTGRLLEELRKPVTLAEMQKQVDLLGWLEPEHLASA